MLFLETFYWKNDKTINIVDSFLFHKSGVKIFLLWFFNNLPKDIY